MQDDSQDAGGLPVLNRSTLDALCTALEEAAVEVLDEYLSDTPQLLDELAEVLEEGDAARAGGLAHQLKSSSAALGGDRVRELAARVEETARTGDGEALSRQCRQLQAAAGTFMQALREYRSGM